MKYDELKPLVFSLNELAYIDESAVEKNFGNPHDHAVYKATEVDTAIAELNDFAENACLERDDNQNVIDELQAENRKLKRALWLARANDARNSYLKWNLFANFESEDKLFTIDEYDETPGATDGQVLRTYTE